MQSIRHFDARDPHLRIITEGAAVDIEIGYKDAEGRPVTRIDVLADDVNRTPDPDGHYWVHDRARLVRLEKGETQLPVGEALTIAEQVYQAACDQLEAALLRQVSARIRQDYPTATRLITYGEYSEDGAFRVRAQSVSNDDVILGEVDAPHDGEDDPWEELTDAIDPLLDQVGDLDVESYQGEAEIELIP